LSLSLLLYAVSVVCAFNHPATTESYTLSLHDALPICMQAEQGERGAHRHQADRCGAQPKHGEGEYCAHQQGEQRGEHPRLGWTRSEEHTSELQSRENLVCRLLLEKKKNKNNKTHEKQA